jgi:hypothetical protein
MLRELEMYLEDPKVEQLDTEVADAEEATTGDALHGA